MKLVIGFKNKNSGPELFLKFFVLGLWILSLSDCLPKKHQLKITRSKTFFNNLGTEPETLHPIKSTDHVASVVQHYMLESLLVRDPHTYEWKPQLAKKWTISPDGKSFVFELFDNLKWSDGKDLTAKDVEFSFSAYRDPAYGGIRYLSYFENMESVKALSPTKIKFLVKKVYFNNFSVIASMDILPKHIYKDPKVKLSKTLTGSGPYLLSHYIRGKVLVLKQNPLWAGKQNFPQQKKWNFPTIVFRFVKTEADTLLRMEKQELDFSTLTAESFVKKTNKLPWGDKIKKVSYSNQEASGYSFIGLNLKKEIFKDVSTRKALAHLVNRPLMNEKFFYGKRELATGPWYFWSDFADSHQVAINFDPKKAQQLLKLAGWKDRDKNGILEKTIQNKKRELTWTIIFSNPDAEKLLTVYQEDLKKAGIQLKLKILDWSAFLKMMDDRKFDAVMLGWSGTIDLDPKQIWHSSSSLKQGSNFISYSNPKVDALIDKGRSQINREDRIKTFRQVYRLIAQDVPYIFLFSSREKFYGLNQRIKNYQPTLNYDRGMDYWSFKKD